MKTRSLNFKVGFVIGVLSLGAIAISYIGLSKVDLMNTAITNLIDGQVRKTIAIKDIRGVFFAQALDQRNILLAGSPAEVEKIKKNMEERHGELLKNIDDFSAKASEQGKHEIADFKEIYVKWWDVTSEIISKALNNDIKGGIALSQEKGAPLRNAGVELLGKMAARQLNEMELENQHTTEEYNHARVLVILFSSVTILLSIIGATFVLISLSRVINKVITDLTGSSEQVSEASQQIASSSEQLSEASSEQAASLEETVATLEELTSMVKVNSDHARQAAQLSEATRNIANKGEEEMRHLMDSMATISQDSKKIEEIIVVIDDIAFQTNLLALNAAVEAARAGEQGKGFAVVAEAVRNLAQRSASAAKDITELIKGSVEKIENGSRQASQSGVVLGEILTSVKKVSDLNAEIATASSEQSNGISQISTAMNQLDQVTQVNAATSEEAAASAHELSAQSIQLLETVNTLKVIIRGGESAAKSTHKENKLTVNKVEAKPAKVLRLPQKQKVTATVKDNVQDDWGMDEKVGTTNGF